MCIYKFLVESGLESCMGRVNSVNPIPTCKSKNPTRNRFEPKTISQPDTQRKKKVVVTRLEPRVVLGLIKEGLSLPVPI